jgi:hypothetical protein
MMIERPETPTTTERAEAETVRPEPHREGGLSTADLAGGRVRTPDDRPLEAAETAPAGGQHTPSAATPLFPRGEAEGFRSRWSETQTGFVDDPRHAVEQADGLVAEVMKRLAETFADERTKLEQQWDRGDQVDTESLRVALQRYRSFFDRLLSL